jgi:hypothetical protein
MKKTAVTLAAALLLAPVLLIGYRVVWLRYPPFPAAPGVAWNLGLEASVKGERGQDTEVSVALPDDRREWIITGEQIESGELSFSLFRKGAHRLGMWSGTLDRAEELISYRAVIVASNRASPQAPSPIPGRYPPGLEKEEIELLKRLAVRWRAWSPSKRVRAAVAAFQGSWGEGGTPQEGDAEGWKQLRERRDAPTALLALLRAARIPARRVEGLRLSEGVETETLVWVEAWTGARWERIEPQRGELFPSTASLLALSVGGEPVVRVKRGEIAQLCWTLSRETLSRWRMHYERFRTSTHWLDRWSLFRLPEEFQETFRFLLLVPMGALMICVLRNMVGFPTFGVFMPVLMALAFRTTGLGYGLAIFATLVLVGYAVRGRLDRLRLLLVPRLSVILTLVIGLFTFLALVGSKTGQRELMAVGLIPFVILTMTIERFFLVVEEAGVREGLKTAAGSALVAALTSQILQWETLQLTFFVYPELILAMAACQVLIGRYTGYRLSEVFRFRAFRGSE